MAIKEIPVQSCEWTCGVSGAKFWIVGTTFAVIAHARDVGASCCVGFCHHKTVICVHAHADDVGDHYPIGGIDKDATHPFEELLWVGAGDKCEIA